VLIYVLFKTRSPHPHWLKFLWIIYSNFMTYLVLLSLTKIQLSPAIFGKNCLGSREPNCISTSSIILRLMAKLKFSTSVLKHICGVLYLTGKINGISGYPSLNGGTTHLTILLLTLCLLNPSMGKRPPLVLSYMLCVSKVQEVENNLTVRAPILFTLKENFVMA
jgi:hypothetical protein